MLHNSTKDSDPILIFIRNDSTVIVIIILSLGKYIFEKLYNKTNKK